MRESRGAIALVGVRIRYRTFELEYRDEGKQNAHLHTSAIIVPAVAFSEVASGRRFGSYFRAQLHEFPSQCLTGS